MGSYRVAIGYLWGIDGVSKGLREVAYQPYHPIKLIFAACKKVNLINRDGMEGNYSMAIVAATK
jgi:hypothetical protein